MRLAVVLPLPIPLKRYSVSLIVGLLLVGLVIDLGGGPDHDRKGFRYWKTPGPFARAGLVENIHTDRFLAFLTVIVQAAFSFQGMELVAIAVSETENPRRNIEKVRSVYYLDIAASY